MKNSYRYAIAWFSLFGFVLLASGIWLFGLKIGFSVEAVSEYYLGSEAAFTRPKSVHGLLETALPHLGSMGLFIMVTGHFLIFTPSKQRPYAIMLVSALFLAALLNILSPFGIIAGLTFFSWVKLLSFAALQVLGTGLLWLIFKAAFSDIIDRHKNELSPPVIPSGALKGSR